MLVRRRGNYRLKSSMRSSTVQCCFDIVVHLGRQLRGVAVADLHITVDGRDSDVESLRDWLRNEPELRGHLREGERPGQAGAMGASTELIVGIISSGAATALVTSLQV